MAEKKTSGVQNKEPKGTGIWYKKLLAGQSKAEFYKHFLAKLKNIITEHFGEAETERVLKGLKTNKVQIVGLESFLFEYEDINDPSLQLYNVCQSPEEFLLRSLTYFKKKMEKGETRIYIRDFFFILSDILKTNKLYGEDRIKELLRTFFLSLLTGLENSPFSLLIVEPKWAQEIGGQLGLSTEKYHTVFKCVLEVLEELIPLMKNVRAFLPQVKIVYPVYYDARDNQLNYLTAHFRMNDRPALVRRTLQDIPDLSRDTPQLRAALECLRSHNNLYFLQLEPVLLELQRLGESTYLKRYPFQNSLAKVFRLASLPKDYYRKFSVQPLFADKELYEKCFVPYYCETEVDCSHISKENLESFIDIAKTLCLTKGYYSRNRRDINDLTFKITLLNVKEVTKEFQDFIKNKLLKIQSITNKKFIIEVFYDKEIVNKKIPEDQITHFRIISDIHADYNAEHGYYFNFGSDFILNCGDTAGNAVAAANWINNYMNQGMFIIGNHLGYSSAYPERDGILNMEKYGNTKHFSNTKAEQAGILFSLTDKQDNKFLSNSCTEYKGIVIIGTCLYTDFNLYGENRREECMAYAKKYMNDFKLPVISNDRYYTQDKHGRWWLNQRKKSESKIITFDTSHHAFYFQFSFEFIKKKVEENKHKPIIILTHHAPSPYSIDEQYKGSMLNPAFASNLNQYIVEHPQIRLWAHGHVHTPCDYILGETRVVCCPFGYNNENNFNLPYEYGLRIPVADIKSKKSWRKIFARQILKGKIQCYDY